MFKKIIFSLIIGALCTLLLMQQDPWLRKEIGQACAQGVAELLDCSISFSDNSLNFFSPSITFYHVKAQSRDNKNWSWQCSAYKTGFSWWNLLIYGTIDLWVVIEGLHAKSELVGNELAIQSHIKTLLATPEWSIPLYIRSFLFDNASVTIFDHTRALIGRVDWSSESQKIKKLFKTRVFVKYGDLSIDHQSYLNQINGLVQFDSYATPQGARLVIQTDNMRFDLPQLPQENKTCFASGIWSEDNGRFMVRNAEQSLIIDPIMVNKQEENIWLKIYGQLPLAYLASVYFKQQETPIAGTSFFTCEGIPATMHGHVKVENAYYYKKQICQSATSTFSKQNDQWHGDISLQLPEIGQIGGIWHWSENTQKGTVSLINNLPINVPYAPYWQLQPNDAHVNIDISQGKIATTYDLKTYNQLLNTSMAGAGTVIIDGTDIHASCTLHDYQLDLVANLNSNTKIQTCICCDPKGNKTVALNATKENELTGFVEYSFVRALLKNVGGYDVQGEGSLKISTYVENAKLIMNMSLIDGNIRLPQTYNFIDTFETQCVYDTSKDILAFNNMRCGLHTGDIYSPRSIIWFDHNKNIAFAHVPLVFERCLFNVQKDLFASVSGNLLLKKEQGSIAQLSGFVMVDRAQLKENIFSPAFQKLIFSYADTSFEPVFDMKCNIAVQTKYPIRVDTAFLETNANMNLVISNRITDPNISGSITLLSGSLKFPYRPLMISKGSLYFLPNQPYDPMVELIAKNKVKQYNIGLHVSGSLNSHHIILDSTPPLSEEQIVSLLLVGSHEKSLNMVMPALIMQNVRHLIFGSNQSSILEKFFVRGNKSFNINLIPSFSDQTGRGGLRGTLEIDVNDRWRALLQKNFSLSEDTRFELEYLLSDDITIRGIRNERRDISTEVEMRWKF